MIKKGSKVSWSMMRGGTGYLRQGEVVAVVQPFNLPNPKHKLSKRPTGLGRDHRSYVVRTDDGKCYWPLVKYLVEA